MMPLNGSGGPSGGGVTEKTIYVTVISEQHLTPRHPEALEILAKADSRLAVHPSNLSEKLTEALQHAEAHHVNVVLVVTRRRLPDCRRFFLIQGGKP